MAHNSLNTITSFDLAHIVDQLNPHDIITLWLCGNKRLQQLLRITVREWRDLAVGAALKWPKLLSELASLRTLSVSVGSCGHLYYTKEDVLALSSTLECLEIEATNSLKWTSKIDLAKVFPNLLSLKLVGETTSITSDNKHAFISLPPQLCSLKVHTLTAAKILSLPVPSSLTRLYIEQWDITDQEIRALPTTLTYLFIRASGITDASISLFPKNLLHLRITSAAATSACFSHLPPLLETFKWSFGSMGETTPALPRGITELTIRSFFAPHSLLTALPPGLRRFDCLLRAKEALDITRIPNTVESLNLPMSVLNTVSLLRDHFANLTDLSFIRIPIDTDLTHFPTTLTRLCIQFVPGVVGGEHVTQFSVVNQFWRLENLSYLNLVNPGYFGAQTLEMPVKALKSLIIEVTAGKTNVTIGPLSNTITELQVPTLDNLDIANKISKLPQKLEILSLPGDQHLSDDDIAQLPRSITSLSLQSNITLSDKCIPHLPPFLREFLVSCNMLLSDACVKYLPRTLHTMACYQAQFTPNSVEHFPKRLFNFKAPASLKHHYKEYRERQWLEYRQNHGQDET